MKDWLIWKKIAKLNIIKSRSAQYLSILNFVMIGKVFVETFDNRRLGYTLLISGVVILIFVGLLDYKYILGPEQEIVWNKNKAFTDMRDKK